MPILGKKIIGIFTCILAMYSQCTAQDLIYSQFNAMPLALNPAFAGNNSCNYRISAIGRTQWLGLNNVKSYKSTTIGGDFNLGNVTDDKQNLWGIGLLGSFDQAGTGNFTNLSLLSNIAYHIRFGKEGTNFISFGLQGGIGQRSVNSNAYIFNDQIDYLGRYTFSTTDPITSDTKLYGDVNFGSMITLNPSEMVNLYFGASLYHLTQPNISFTAHDYTLPTRYNFHGGANIAAGNLIILPSAYYQYQQLSNWNVGTYLGKVLLPGNEEMASVIGYLGLWYKSTDALAAAARLDFSSFTLAFSYDIHTGGVSKNLNSIGSPELSINYFGCFKRNSRKTGCPSL